MSNARGKYEQLLIFITKAMLNTKSNQFREVLTTLYKLILEGMEKQQPEKIAASLAYLEQLKLKSTISFFSSTHETLGMSIEKSEAKALKNVAKKVLKQAHSTDELGEIKKITPKPPDFTLIESQRKIAGAIHVSLMNLYKINPHWRYSYPLDESGQVLNDTIGHYQNELLRQNEAKTKEAHRDFLRNVEINGQSGSDFKKEGTTPDECISNALDNLLEDTENKDALKKFISNMGGQAMISLATELFTANEFNKNQNTIIYPLKSLQKTANWTLNENSRPEFNCILKVLGLSNLIEEQYIFLDQNNQEITSKNPEHFYEYYHDELANDEDKIPSIVDISFKIELDVDKIQVSRVMPIVKELTVTCRTNKLHSPGFKHGFKPEEPPEPSRKSRPSL